MIRPYLAILKDSFREAMASRVLWIALIGIVVVLLALSPTGLRTDQSLKLRQHELADPEGLVRSISEGAGQTETVAGHLWSLLDEGQQKRIRDWLDPTSTSPPPDPRPGRQTSSLRSQVVRLVNGLIKNDQFATASAWQNVNIDAELQQLRGKTDLTESESAIRNLKLLAAAFPRSVALRDDPAVIITYAGTDMIGPIDAMPSQFERLLNLILVRVLSVFLGFFGVFGSLLVTASMIPGTYAPGEISLLLSKPVSRSLLFLTRFLGGCIFTLLCAGLLVTGIWLLLGTRLGIWRHELLWCIPVYVFLFAVYFSVSAFTGLIWRNSVVALVVVFLFWALLFTVGATKTLVDQNIIQARKIIEITPAGEEMFVVDGNRNVQRWDSAKGDWSRVFDQQDSPIPRFMRSMFLSGTRFRPIYDPEAGRIFALQRDPSRFGGPAPATVVSGTADGNWERETEGRTPDTVYGIFADSKNRIILPGPRAIHEFTGLTDRQKQTRQFLGGWLGGLITPSSKQAFRDLTPARMPAGDLAADATLDAGDNSLFNFSGGILQRFDRAEDGPYSIGPRRDLETKSRAVLASAGRNLVIALGNGTLLALDKATLETVAEKVLPDEDQPRSAEASSDGSRLAVLTHAGRLIVFSDDERKFLDWAPKEDGTISAFAFDDQNRLIIANGRRRLTTCDGSGKPLPEIWNAPEDWIYATYDLVIMPLYTLLPRPSDMDEAIAWLITGERTVVTGMESGETGGSPDRENLQKDRQQLKVAAPIRDNLLFIAVMLTAGCIFLSRRDF